MLEYKVTELHFDKPSILEEKLNELAKDNWECSQVLLIHRRASFKDVLLILNRDIDKSG